MVILEQVIYSERNIKVLASKSDKGNITFTVKANSRKILISDDKAIAIEYAKNN